jgi:flagellar basal body rod protein FlgG
MDGGLSSGLASMRSNEKRLDTIAANLANVDTNAYKRLGTVTQSFAVEPGSKRRTELSTENAIDYTQGVVDRTGNTFDLALEGEGFFAVEGKQGELYTRNGAFHLDENGVLHTEQGDPVAWEGAQGRLAPTGEAVMIDGLGSVSQGGNTLGRLRIVDFADKTDLRQDSRSYFVAPRDLRPTASTAVVHQGALERSNVSSIEELVALVRVQRDFESAASLLRSIDQSYRRLNGQR